MVSLANWLNILANQTQNFTALMNNFQVAIDATATAMDSAGSAMKENASYMESLEAQTTQLKATFQDFANNVIDKELVSSILTLANDVLGALNTETGKTITQWGLLTGVLTGGITIYGQIAGKLLSAGSAVITLGKALSAGEATATMFTSAALPLAAAIGAIAVAGWKVYEWYKETHQPLSEYTSQIESNNEQLEKNKERLEEINKMSWVDRTPDILAEKESLEKENAELRENIALNEKRSLDQAKRLANQEVTITTGSRYKSSLLGMDWASEEEAIKDINDIYGEGTWIASVYIKTLKEVNTTITAQGDALNNYLINELEKYDDILRSNNGLTEEEQIARNNIIQVAKSQVETYQFLDEKVGGLTESQENLISAYNESALAESVAKNEMVALNQEGVSALLANYPQLKSAIEDVNGVSYLNVTALGKVENATVKDKVAMYDLIAAQTVFNNSSLDVSAKIAQLAALAEQAGATAASIATVMGVSSSDFSRTAKGLVQTKQAKNEQEATQILLKRMYGDMLKTIPTGGGTVEGTPTYPSTASSTTKNKNKNKTTNKTTTKKATDLALEEFKNLQRDLEHQRELDLISEAGYYNKLEQLVKNYKAKATAHMKEYGTDADTINRNMYQYEEEIYKGRTKLADELKEQQEKAAEEATQAQKEAAEKAAKAQKEAAEKAAKAQKEALEKQKEDFETAVSYVVKQIDKEIDKLQDLRDQTEKQKEDFETAVDYVVKQIDKEIGKLQDLRGQTEKYYDDKIDAVNKANDALEDQIHYEELLNNLAKAKDKQLYVFQNGQFQYAQDVETIASAQDELDAYERGEALRKEVENLETLKEQALASIDEQIAGWEKYKEQWESITTQYQEQQEKLLAEQVLGIDTEQENWETRLTNLQSFVDQYNAIDLASIDKQIEGWEKYKEEWEGVTTQYQEQQDKLLAEQILGIDTEQENWETRVVNVQDFADQYNSICQEYNSIYQEQQEELLAEQVLGTDLEQKNWETRLVNLQSFVDQYNAILSQLNSGTTISSTGNATGRGEGNFVSGSGAWSGIPHDDTDSDFDRDEVIKNNTSIGKGRDYLAEAIAAADKGLIDKAYALLDERDKKLDAQGRNSAGGVNKEESREIINVHLDAYTTTKHANGTISAPGGLSLVGEKGPELRVLNSGDGIIPADATRNLWDWASYNPKDFMGTMGSDNIFHIGNIALPNVTDAKSFVNGLKQLAYQRAYKRA